MENELIKSIVCICHENETPEGTGLLIDNKHIVTCAHVVASVVGKDINDNSIVGSKLKVIVYSSEKPVTLKAKVVKIQPQDNIDFAGLEIVTNQYIKSISNKFLSNNLLSGHQFKAFGFPTYYSKGVYNKGVWAYGEIRGRQADSLVQVECNPNSAYFIKTGFSGTPVWDDKLNGWVGIINKADTLESSNGATMIPASVLHKCWSEVIELATTTEEQYLSQLVENMQDFSGIVAYLPPNISVTYKTAKPEPYEDKSRGIKWSSEFDDSVSKKRTDNGYETTEVKKAIEEVISIYPKLVILGDLGAGKTTSLQHTVIKLAQKRLNTGSGLIPVFVDLSDEWIKPSTDNSNASYLSGLKNLLKKHWTLETDLEEMLSAGKAIVFLDGLNEMGSDKLYKRKAIRSWLQAQSSPRYAIFTCRNSSYNNELDLGLPTATIRKLETDAWISIATNLINHINRHSKNQVNLEDFLNLIRSKEQLNRILSRPYFVELLVKIYVSGGSIPSTEALILNDFVQIVWKRERQQQPDLPDFSAMKTILGHLAFLLVSGQKFTVAYSEIVKESIGFFSRFFKSNEVSNLNTILKACTQADLLKNEGENYKFADEFFMDYFAACHMVDNPTKIPKLPEEDGIYVPQLWTKPISYFYFLLPEEDEDLRNTIEKLVKHNPFIATESVLISDSRLKHRSFLTKNLLDLLEQKHSSYFKRALILSFKKIGSQSHNQIVQIIDDKQASLDRKALAIWLSGELRIMKAVPKLNAIISTEPSLKAELKSLTMRKERLSRELTGEQVKDGMFMFGEFALKFAFAILSGSPANLNTAGQTLKEPRAANGQLSQQKQQEISKVDKQIADLDNFLSSAKEALKRINSKNSEQ